MAATFEDIKGWLNRGKEKGATHVIVVCDTYDFDDYPVYVLPTENVHEVEKKYYGNMQRIMEVYNLSMDIDKQMKQVRAFNY
jgi:hypothetical protein